MAAPVSPSSNAGVQNGRLQQCKHEKLEIPHAKEFNSETASPEST